MKQRLLIVTTCIVALWGCNTPKESVIKESKVYVGADLSYVNEILDCGGEFRSEGALVDPYELFAQKGTDLVRLRLWHNPEWSGYSDLEDVKLAIKRSKELGMEILLDFHYSDTWADPQHQVIPKAWEEITDVKVLSDSLYYYTYQTLEALHADGLLPEFVQVGNETNIEVMQDSAMMNVDTINWERNLALINAGLKAVNDFSLLSGVDIQRMIHIAQPENALWWFGAATKYGLGDFEWIALSYYPKWSAYGLDELSIALDSLIKTYEKELMIVETAYPHSLVNVDGAGNILGEDALIAGYEATPDGQLRFMQTLIEQTVKSGGKGVIYWEPAWVTSTCETPWGKGSHWENASFFDGERGNEALPAMEIFNNY
jgi:arabinogalactan endo-1,4-beta-galactosidase